MKKAIQLLTPFLLSAVAYGVEVLVEAESFDHDAALNYGGWVLDQQFMDQMGSPFLLAHGLGRPVADATKTQAFPQAGVYHVWVRTREWTATWRTPETPAAKKADGDPPGCFQVLVDGVPLRPTAVFGSEGDLWHWQYGGIVTVNQTTVNLALHDLTGFEGRCDAILFTTEASFMPPNDETLCDWRRALLNTETVTAAGDYDLVVIGGGIAGTCAAIKAARFGLSVALIQDRPVLGGNASSEVRVHPRGETNFEPYPRIGDLVRAIVPSDAYDDARKLAFVEAEPNIRLFLNHRGNGVEMNGEAVAAVLTESTETGERLRIGGRLFADCTGDGCIGHLAGADWEMTTSDGTFARLGSTNLWRFADTGAAVAFPSVPWALNLDAGSFPTSGLGSWFWESGFYHDPFEKGEYIRDWNLRAAYGAWDALKNKMTGYDRHYSQWQAFVSGKRESRRLLGDVVLTQSDIVSAIRYPDGCVPTTWTIDLHYPHDTYGVKRGFGGDEFISTARHTRFKTPYWLPYRCLYSRNISNLFMAGRDISVTHEALGTVRVQRTTGMMGEIVGLAASLCIEHDTTPRGVYQEHLLELQGLMRNPEPPATPNVALGKPVTVDSVHLNYVGANAVDGDRTSISSRWLSTETDYPHWIAIDLQGNYLVSQVSFWTGYQVYENPPSEFQFQRWDGSDWMDIFAVTGNEDAVFCGDFSPVLTSRVRLYMTAGVSKYVRLFEIAVTAASDPGDTTPPANPTGLTAELGPQGASLDWDDNVETDLGGYNVYRSLDRGGDRHLVAINVQASDFVDWSATNETVYYYVVSAEDLAGNESGFSNEAKLVPPVSANVALLRPVTVDSTYRADYPGPNAVDGDRVSNSSRWLSAETPYPHWIEIDLGETYLLTELRFWTGYNGYNRPVADFSFQRPDGGVWVDIFSERGNTSAVYRRSFTPAIAERVRLHATAGMEADNTLRLYEIEIVGVSPPTLGDFDRDGDVDRADLEHLQECSSGASVPQVDPRCDDAHLDPDADVDLSDFGIFQRCYSGQDNPVDPGCAN